MSEPTLDILGIGNAIVDVLARADDDFLAARGLDKGGMRLIDAAEADTLYGQMGPGLESSGGSAGNTCAVAAPTLNHGNCGHARSNCATASRAAGLLTTITAQ